MDLLEKNDLLQHAGTSTEKLVFLVKYSKKMEALINFYGDLDEKISRKYRNPEFFMNEKSLFSIDLSEIRRYLRRKRLLKTNSGGLY